MTSKRIFNEVQRLVQIYPELDDINIIIHKNNTMSVVIGNKTFKIPQNYPFNKPSLTINGEPYNSFLKTFSLRILHILSQNKIECLCCTTLLCGIWSPVYSVDNLLKEIVIMNGVKRRVKYQIYLEDIAKNRNYPNFIIYRILNFLDC